MVNTRREKKSETLEVRLPHSKKEAFKAACEDEGITASHAVRTFIDAYLKRSRRVKLKHIAEDITMKLFRNPLKTAGMTLVSGCAAIMLVAQPSVANDALFASFDTNENGVLDETELDRDIIHIVDTSRNNQVEPDEFRPHITIRGVTDTIRQLPEGTRVREVVFVIRDLTFHSGNETSLNVWSCSETIEVTATEEVVQSLVQSLTRKCEDGLLQDL